MRSENWDHAYEKFLQEESCNFLMKSIFILKVVPEQLCFPELMNHSLSFRLIPEEKNKGRYSENMPCLCSDVNDLFKLKYNIFKAHIKQN